MSIVFLNVIFNVIFFCLLKIVTFYFDIVSDL